MQEQKLPEKTLMVEQMVRKKKYTRGIFFFKAIKKKN